MTTKESQGERLPGGLRADRTQCTFAVVRHGGVIARVGRIATGQWWWACQVAGCGHRSDAPPDGGRDEAFLGLGEHLATFHAHVPDLPPITEDGA